MCRIVSVAASFHLALSLSSRDLPVSFLVAVVAPASVAAPSPVVAAAFVLEASAPSPVVLFSLLSSRSISYTRLSLSSIALIHLAHSVLFLLLSVLSVSLQVL